MINALREIANAPEGKYFNSLSPSVCGFLLSCYKDDGRFWLKFYLSVHPFGMCETAC